MHGDEERLTRAEEFALSSPIRQIGTWGVVALVALRLGIGWHFYKEGVKKFEGDKYGQKKFTSLYFLQSAKGPLADFYQSMIPDRYGRERLSLDGTVQYWSNYKDRAAGHFGFDEKQRERAEALIRTYTGRMKNFLNDAEGDLSEYFLEVDRLQQERKSDTRKIPFQRDRIAAKEAELRGKVGGWLKDVDTLSAQLQADLYEIATPDQRKRGQIAISDRGAPLADTLVKYTVLGIGVLLVLGLFSRLACLAGIGFLLSVISTQPPWVPGAETSYFYYQMVEVLALIVLIAFAAGRFAGLDYVIHGLYVRCCAPKISAN